MSNDVGLSRNFTWDFHKTHGWTSNSKFWFSCRFGPFTRVGPCRARLCLTTSDCHETLRGTSLIHTDGLPTEKFGFRVDLARLPVSGPFMSNDVGLSRNFAWDFPNTHGWLSNSKFLFSCRFGPFTGVGPCRARSCLTTSDCHVTLRGTSLIQTDGFPTQNLCFRVDLARGPCRARLCQKTQCLFKGRTVALYVTLL
jgi:hypothetical protein